MNDNPAHGLYTEKGKKIKEWQGRIVMDFDTGDPRLEPMPRLARGERVFAWYHNELVAVFSDQGLIRRG